MIVSLGLCVAFLMLFVALLVVTSPAVFCLYFPAYVLCYYPPMVCSYYPTYPPCYCTALSCCVPLVVLCLCSRRFE